MSRLGLVSRSYAPEQRDLVVYLPVAQEASSGRVTLQLMMGVVIQEQAQDVSEKKETPKEVAALLCRVKYCQLRYQELQNVPYQRQWR